MKRTISILLTLAMLLGIMLCASGCKLLTAGTYYFYEMEEDGETYDADDLGEQGALGILVDTFGSDLRCSIKLRLGGGQLGTANGADIGFVGDFTETLGTKHGIFLLQNIVQIETARRQSPAA